MRVNGRCDSMLDRARPNSPAPLQAMFDHYEHHGLLSNAVTLTAVLKREPRSLRAYFEELAAGRGG